MKLSEWAYKNGLSYRTAHRLFKANKLPVPSHQLETGTILVYESEETKPKNTVLYARVSSHDQKQDLERQLQRLRDFSASHGYKVNAEISEIGSGLNDKRRKLNQILSNKNIGRIIVEHRDRLARFGVQMLIESFKASNREIVIINKSELKNDLVQDFVDVVTSMCARIYGKRSAKNKAQKALKAIDEDL